MGSFGNFYFSWWDLVGFGRIHSDLPGIGRYLMRGRMRHEAGRGTCRRSHLLYDHFPYPFFPPSTASDSVAFGCQYGRMRHDGARPGVRKTCVAFRCHFPFSRTFGQPPYSMANILRSLRDQKKFLQSTVSRASVGGVPPPEVRNIVERSLILAPGRCSNSQARTPALRGRWKCMSLGGHDVSRSPKKRAPVVRCPLFSSPTGASYLTNRKNPEFPAGRFVAGTAPSVLVPVESGYV